MYNINIKNRKLILKKEKEKMKNNENKNLEKLHEIFGDDLKIITQKDENYNELNWDAKLFFENIIIRDTTNAIDMYPRKNINNLKLYEDQLLDLCDKNILFFLRILYEFRRKEHTEIILYNYNNFFDKCLSFLEFLNFTVEDSDEKTDSDICIGIVDDHPMLLEFFINKEYKIESGAHPLYAIPCNNDFKYVALPNIYYLRTDQEYVKKITSIPFHFNEYSGIEFLEDYTKYVEDFITFKIIEIRENM